MLEYGHQLLIALYCRCSDLQKKKKKNRDQERIKEQKALITLEETFYLRAITLNDSYLHATEFSIHTCVPSTLISFTYVPFWMEGWLTMLNRAMK